MLLGYATKFIILGQNCQFIWQNHQLCLRFSYLFHSFCLQRQRDECSDDRRWRDDVGPAAARGIGAACLQTIRHKEETKPGSLEPQHDSSQRNNVSNLPEQHTI